MYFVTIKNPAYVLFCMTPSERAAVALTEKNEVHLLLRGPGNSWQPLRQWSGTVFSHTDYMSALGKIDEPSDPRELIGYLPPSLRD